MNFDSESIINFHWIDDSVRKEKNMNQNNKIWVSKTHDPWTRKSPNTLSVHSWQQKTHVVRSYIRFGRIFHFSCSRGRCGGSLGSLNAITTWCGSATGRRVAGGPIMLIGNCGGASCCWASNIFCHECARLRLYVGDSSACIMAKSSTSPWFTTDFSVCRNIVSFHASGFSWSAMISLVWRRMASMLDRELKFCRDEYSRACKMARR